MHFVCCKLDTQIVCAQATHPEANGKQRFHIWLEPELKDALRLIAEAHDRPLGAEIRRALKKHVTAEARQAA